MRITAEDRKAIVAEARRIARSKAVRIEIRCCWVEGLPSSTFNIYGQKVVDIDDTGQYYYSFDEFQRESKSDERCNEALVMLDVLVAKRGWDGYEPVDWVYPIFESGRLSRFGGLL